uniref:MFS transporter n=1 Tax=Macrostomum lignano TaxID=282301 RepID=A0A1I8IKN3_9PLAT
RLFIVALTVIGVLWLPIVRTSGGGQLVIYAQSVTSYLTPPILTVFLMASLWPRTTEPGVFWGLLVSMVIGVVWMVLNFVYPPPQCGEADTRPAPIAQLHFLHFGIALFAFAALIMTAISLLTKPVDREQTVMVHTPVSRRAFRFFLRWFCGFSDDDNGGAATEEERKAADTAEAAERARQLVAEMKSGSAWDRVVNCSALLLFAVGSFLWGLLA